MTTAHRYRRGNTIVEMALALPVFLLMVFGVLVLGTIYNHQMAINTAARDGARLAAVGTDNTTVVNQVKAITPNLNHDTDRFGVAVGRGSSSVTVTVEYTEKVGVPVLSILFNNKKLTARAEHFYETDFISR